MIEAATNPAKAGFVLLGIQGTPCWMSACPRNFTDAAWLVASVLGTVPVGCSKLAAVALQAIRR
jgi:hypothetical protein